MHNARTTSSYRTTESHMSPKPFVLFVCRHNTGRSQMAEAYLRHFAGDAIEVASAGTEAADAPHEGVVAAMAEDGIDISRARPKLIDSAVVARADRIITMGCDVRGVPRIDGDWGLPDPKHQSAERVREIREMVKERARALAAELLPEPLSPGIAKSGHLFDVEVPDDAVDQHLAIEKDALLEK